MNRILLGTSEKCLSGHITLYTTLHASIHFFRVLNSENGFTRFVSVHITFLLNAILNIINICPQVIAVEILGRCGQIGSIS